MKKYIRLSVFIIMEFLIIIMCVLFGKYLNSTAQKRQMLTIEKIALVNLDEGIEVGNLIKNYGVEFIGSLDGDYEVTGLEQARTGLENGRYAAYIIIPAAFSKNIDSINGEPVKSNIVYKINRNLEAATREKVITDITSFNSDLSTNIEYVFLDAMLKEVHMVQDKLDYILDNDQIDLKNILKFAQSELVVDPDYPEEKSVNSQIPSLDLSNEYAVIQGIFAKLSDSYKQDEENAQEAVNQLIHVKDEIDKKMNVVDKEIRAINDNGAETNQYIDGAEDYQEFVSSYNDALLSWEETNSVQVENNFKEYLSSCDQYVAEQVNSLLNKQKEYLVNYYVNVFAGPKENEVSFNFDQEEAENYLNITELHSYQYLKQTGSENTTYKREYQDLGNNIRNFGKKVTKNPYRYEVEVDGEKKRETGYLMTAEDIEQLMKWIADLKEGSDITESGDLEDQLADCLKKDASAIGKAAEQQKNASFIELQKESFYDALIHYGAEKKESIENYVAETQYTQFNKDAIDEIINQFYNPDLKIVVKANIQQKNIPVEDSTGQEEENDQPTSETVETTEDNNVQENTEEETTTEEKEPGTDKEEREEGTLHIRKCPLRHL